MKKISTFDSSVKIILGKIEPRTGEADFYRLDSKFQILLEYRLITVTCLIFVAVITASVFNIIIGLVDVFDQSLLKQFLVVFCLGLVFFICFVIFLVLLGSLWFVLFPRQTLLIDECVVEVVFGAPAIGFALSIPVKDILGVQLASPKPLAFNWIKQKDSEGLQLLIKVINNEELEEELRFGSNIDQIELSNIQEHIRLASSKKE